ncbi:hypothetical protein GJ697_13455 [Pseudoduganella sp. FT25W]|uniref:Uncharacterized protein n=1 Tax=Duganella alba TaxID=2666081 RepID=A0A6L5QGE4_9BURK|nr:hypothetical protein [Duganella alba]MRX08844.1 hypothetical protein [Duganella alba]MRX18862.1 hypothetical protein [Duganella alba]
MARSLGRHAGTWDTEIDRPLEVRQGDTLAAYFYLLTSTTHLFVTPDGGKSIMLNPSYLEEIQKVAGQCSCVVVALDGNVHNWNFITEWSPPFDFFDPDLPDKLQAGVQIISGAVIEDYFGLHAPKLMVRLQLLKAIAPDVPHYLLQPPPPIPSGPQIKSHWDEYTKKDSVIADKWLRLKIYKVYMRVLENCCRQLGMTMIAPPRDRLDPDGFLPEQYWRDSTHASEDFYHDTIPGEP